MTSIVVNNVSKRYSDNNLILDGFNLSIKSGEIYSIIGPSGCGKTTLLQCILGMKDINNGSIYVLGERVSAARLNKFSNLIGYMPQQTDMMAELTIKETMEYFGGIFEMNEKLFEERLEAILDLLELPSDDRKVGNLSGGEKRRVSMAIAILHRPMILILDEPTVGVDSILRAKIWNFLKHEAAESNLSIIITTHYTAEAIKSDKIGFMRDGRLLIQDTPGNILTRTNSETLDEAFFNLSLKSALASKVPKEELKEFELPIRKLKRSKCRVFSALLKKEYIRIKRSPMECFILFALPLMHVIIFRLCVGGLPNNIRLGIINHEASCTSQSKIDQNASCFFIDEISFDNIYKIFYGSDKMAHYDSKRGKIDGFIEIMQNFSAAFADEENFSENSEIKVRLDHSNYLVAQFLKQQIAQAYENFSRKYFNVTSVMKLEKSFYGSLLSDYRNTMTPPFLLRLSFLCCLIFSCLNVNNNRLYGLWNRTLLAGVTQMELFVVQLFTSSVAIIITIFQCIFGAPLLFDTESINNWLDAVLILFLICAASSAFGIFLSMTISDMNYILNVAFFVIEASSMLSGFMWPLEGQHWLLKSFSYMMPLTSSSIALRDVIFRGFTHQNASVFNGMSVLSLWVIGSLAVTYFYLKKKKIIWSN